ncbi:flp/Fap pilin component [bacterium BMS3Bbin10]|nr:flp/Fap pilin component [bacterium BMS3Bbin10]HDL16691.1 Flp family type IVb pilin [Hyphomicrobiales bacterium]
MSEKEDTGPKARNLMASFANERSGATAIEYGIIAGSLSIAIAVSVNGIGSALNTIFTTVVGLF